jgi:hypothetical protein
MTSSISGISEMDRGRECDCRGCYVTLAKATALGDALDDMAILIPRAIVHRGVDPHRIASQHSFDCASGFEECVPIQRCDRAHAGDRVPHRDLIRGLPKVLLSRQLLGGRFHLRALARHPLHRSAEQDVVLTETSQQLNQESGGNE